MMPSLWKKEKGNHISRLVADLQTTPKPGESLVIETGFPTSLVDLFVKNRDKLKKHNKTKKHKSKKALTLSEEDDNDPLQTSVSNSCDSLSIGENCEKNATQIDNRDVFVEKPVSHEKHDAEFHNNTCKIEGNKSKTEVMGVTNQRNMNLLPILVGALVLILVLYTKRWFLAFITFGIQLLLLLLQYVGNHVLKLFKPCENVISMPILKGGLAVVVALYTKCFVLGVKIGASLFLLIEYAGKLGFRLFKPCQDIQWRLQGFFSQLGVFKRRRMFDGRGGRSRGRGVLTRSGLIGSKRELRKEGIDDSFSNVDFDQEEIGDGVMSRKEVEPQLGTNNNLSFEDGDDVASKGVIEPQCGSITYVNDTSSLNEEDSRNKPMYELLALESKNSKSLMRRSNITTNFVGCVDLQGEKGAIEGKQKGIEDTKIVNHNGKNKKGKKFWKKLVPKKKNKKHHKNEQRKGLCDGTSIDDIHDVNEVELDEEDEVDEGGHDISDGEGSSVLSSYEEDDEGGDNLGVGDRELSEFDNRASGCGMIKEKHENPKYLVILMIPLTGLIEGRLFAVVLTLICCLVFKLVRG